MCLDVRALQGTYGLSGFSVRFEEKKKSESSRWSSSRQPLSISGHLVDVRFVASHPRFRGIPKASPQSPEF